jgi:AcrR family transcriptional regulator
MRGKRAEKASGRERSPRPYDLAKRRAAADGVRSRCVDAARRMLRDGVGADLRMEEVARRAGVTRQTLYNQFGSRGLLVEAVFDELARSGGMERMAAAMQQSDPEVTLREMVGVMVRFWSADRAVMRRIRVLAATDAVLQEAVRARDERRRMACRRVVGGFGAVDDIRVDVVFALTSFEFVDALAGEGRSPVAVAEMVVGLARAGMGLG